MILFVHHSKVEGLIHKPIFSYGFVTEAYRSINSRKKVRRPQTVKDYYYYEYNIYMYIYIFIYIYIYIYILYYI